MASFIDLRHVHTIDPEAVAAFLSIIQSREIKVRGNQPINPPANSAYTTSDSLSMFTEWPARVTNQGRSERKRLEIESTPNLCTRSSRSAWKGWIET